MRHRLLLLAVALIIAAPLIAADEKDVKPKEKEKEKEKETVEWTQVFSVSNAPGGKKHFDLPRSGKVKFSWETTPDGQVPQFRVTVSKLNERNGSYQTLGTVTSVFGASKSAAVMDLTEGKYQLYIATKFMKYTLNVEQRGK